MKRIVFLLVASRLSILICLTLLFAGASRGDMAPPRIPVEGYPSVRVFAIDPSAPQTIYAGSSNGVFKCVDGGSNWKEVNNASLTKASISALAIDPSTSETVYAISAGKVFKTTDGGSNWTTVKSPWPIEALALDPSAPQTVYGASAAGELF
jgi:hypothetical protein